MANERLGQRGLQLIKLRIDVGYSTRDGSESPKEFIAKWFFTPPTIPDGELLP